jgi:hypothetical protein
VLRSAVRTRLAPALAVAALACTRATTGTPTTTSPAATSPVTPPPTTGPPTTVTTSVAPPPSPVPSLPPGVPPGFEDDVASGNVPAAALIPLRAEVAGTWYGATEEGDAIVVAWRMPSEDPYRTAQGVVAWRRFDDDGAPWRPVWGETFPARAMLLANTAEVGEVTGDASDEVVVFAETGGSGGCGSYTVVELATGTPVYDRPDVCDTRLVTDPSIPGLILTEAVYRAGDAHCCPSAFRTTTLTYEGDGAWHRDAVLSEV